MDVIPGIDLLDHKCVCAVYNSFAEDHPTSHDPTEVAQTLKDQGARRFYVADLEGAQAGEPQNLEALKKLVASSVPVDFGGGIRTVKTARRILDMGVDRIVIGTTAALDDRLATEILSEYGPKTIVSLAIMHGFVAIREWQARTDEKAETFAQRMVGLGAQRMVVTDVFRKALKGGVNIQQLNRILASVDIPLIASGGISSLDDVRKLKKMESSGLEGMIIVTALYQGNIKLPEAIAIAEADPAN